MARKENKNTGWKRTRHGTKREILSTPSYVRTRDVDTFSLRFGEWMIGTRGGEGGIVARCPRCMRLMSVSVDALTKDAVGVCDGTFVSGTADCDWRGKVILDYGSRDLEEIGEVMGW